MFLSVPAFRPPVFERIDIAERVNVGKVELDDIVSIVEQWAWVCYRDESLWNGTMNEAQGR